MLGVPGYRVHDILLGTPDRHGPGLARCAEPKTQCESHESLQGAFKMALSTAVVLVQ